MEITAINSPLFKTFTILFIILPGVFFTTPVLSETALPQLTKGNHRSAEHIARNTYRHPIETLAFFKVSDEMTVVEIWPGAGGWYTEILAPFLKDKGTLYGAHFASDSKEKFFTDSLNKFKQKTAQHPEIYNKIILTELDAPRKVILAPPGSVDRVLTFRNVHNWLRQDENGLAVFKAMFDALKPGGILGVVEHRAPADFSLEQMQTSGYTTEAFTIALAERAGFKLVAKSEINANPMDTKDHPKGVWTLPPTLKLGDKNKEKYLAIGESDRMTLKFVKPLK